MRRFLLLLVFSASAAAQTGTYSVYASQADLDDGGTLAGALPTCLAAAEALRTFNTTPVVFFDRTSGALAAYDPDAAAGARTAVLASAEALAAAAGAPIAACIDAEEGSVFRPAGGSGTYVFLAVTTTAGTSAILRVGLDGAVTRLTDPAAADDGRGVTGIASGETPLFGQPFAHVLFLARSALAGAPASGVYVLDPDVPGGSPVALALAADADPVGVAYVQTNLGVRVASSSAGAGDFRNAVLLQYGTTLSPTGFPAGLDPTTGLLGDVATDHAFAGDTRLQYALVYDRGSDRVLAEHPLDSSTQVLFSAADLVAATGISGFAPAGASGVLAVLQSYGGEPSRIVVAGSGESGAAAGIYSAAGLTLITDAVESAPSLAAGVAVYPLPTVGRGTVRVSVAEASASASVTVVDALGRRVAVLHDGPLGAGDQTFAVDVARWPAGVYVVRVDVGGARASARLVVAR